MYYSKISCNVNNSLEKLRTYRLSEMIDVDCSAIITVTDYGKIKIDGSQNYNDDKINENTIISILSRHISEITNLEEGIIFKEIENDSYYDIIITPIRHFNNYYVYTISCKKNGNYTEKDIRIMEFVTRAIYENVLLDYEIVKERNYLQNIFNSAKSFILTVDLNEIIISVNKKVAEILGNEVIGQQFKLYLEDGQYIKIKKLYRKVIENNRTVSGEEEFFFNHDGKRYYINYSLSPITDQNNEVIGVVVLGLDVTKQKIYEREIEQLKQYALLGEISAEVAHDIKNPLMSIRGCARLLEKKIEDIEIQEYISPIIEEVDRIDKIVEQMLSYSRLSIENGFDFIDINAVLDKCIDAVSFHKQFKYITIEKDYADDIPYIEGRDIRIQQSFMNILLNAMQAIDNEGLINIKTESIMNEKQIKITISDNGTGICESDKKKIFEPFFTTKKRGTGLGLSIVSKVMKELGGYCRVESALGKGSKFILVIPYKKNGR